MIKLPAWNDMADLDKGAALMHMHKRDVEGSTYATRHYPCRYLQDPRLVALTPAAASRHAANVAAIAFDTWGDEESRLYDLALNEEDRRWRETHTPNQDSDGQPMPTQPQKEHQ